MPSFEGKRIIAEYKKKSIEGLCINFVPCKFEYCEKIVLLRNQDKSRYFLNQTDMLTMSKQKDWYKKYELRDDDIYWCIFDKKENFIGTLRLYDIDFDKGVCNQGSFIIDEAYAMSGPFSLEAELISLRFAFNVLQMKKVRNDDRIDNTNMNSISRRLGFTYIKDFEMNSVMFRLYELNRENFKYEQLETALKHWIDR